jgi:hypothetical protein
MTVIWLMKSWPSVALLEFRYVIQMSGRIEIRISVWLTKITISNKNKSNCQYYQKHEGGTYSNIYFKILLPHQQQSLFFICLYGLLWHHKSREYVYRGGEMEYRFARSTSTGSCIDISSSYISRLLEQFYMSKRSPWGTRTRKPNDWEADTRINNGACLAESCHILFGILKQKFDCQKPISILETNIPSYEWFKRRKKRCQECQGRPMWMLSDGPPSRRQQ